ncbi:MAG: hypothetical protein JO353_00740 [Phycisphaerae bacterium]|nr:hypothetical protein [Phycisphaerae bacterium]
MANWTYRGIIAVFSLVLIAESSALAAGDSILPGRPDADKPTAQEAQELGAPFESVAAGIAFRPPAGMKKIVGMPGDVIVRYVDDDRHWVLAVSKLNFEKPVALASTIKVDRDSPATMPSTQPGADKGLLETTADQMKIDAPGVEVLRKDVVPIGGTDVGMIAARYSVGPQTNLTQQGLFRVNDKNYYLFNLTVPAPRQGNVSDDPQVQTAVATFNSVLETVRLLEQTAIREEQDQRLFHTRTLFVNLTQDKIRQALVKEQWLRLKKDGKDIGYSYVAEEVGRDLPRAGHAGSAFATGDEGPLIGIRSRTFPEAGTRVDAETWMWMSFDRKNEKWSNIAIIDRGPDATGKPQRRTVGDVGSSYVTQKTVYDKDLIGHGEEIKQGQVDAQQPPFRVVDVHMLDVEHIGKNQDSTPVLQQLPVFYIPQALAYLLPELLPRKQPNTYMFASYVAERRAVMSRYVDVGGEDQVTIGNKTVLAVPVKDRFGLEGAATINYISPDGTYLESDSPDTKVQVFPSDAATLQQIWKDANLTRPGAVEDAPVPPGKPPAPSAVSP